MLFNSVSAVIPACDPIINDNTKGIQYTTCLKNVATFIDNNGPYDFVGLQEATNWMIIQQISTVLNNMNAVFHKPGKEDIVTFYEKKYQLDDTDATISCQMENSGRPILILFFKQKICVINIHAGHKNDIFNFDKYLSAALNSPTYLSSIQTFLNKLKTYNIIMLGDFNHKLFGLTSFNILHAPTFNIRGGINLYGINKQKSCCDNSMMGYSINMVSDHILSTYTNNNSIVYNVPFASDHMPIISNIQAKQIIGYDFDGVLHTDVGPPDATGQRNPINYTGPYTPFKKIIAQIENDINDGNTVYIITARYDNPTNNKAITTFLNSILSLHGEQVELGDLLPSSTKLRHYKDQIKIYFSNGENKSAIINKLGVNVFYDDSCLRITELYNEIQNGKLSQLKQLIFVIPEKNIWEDINDQNISVLCFDQRTAEQSNTIKTNTKKTIIEQSNIKQSNIKQSNIRQSNIRQSNIRQSNIRQSKTLLGTLQNLHQDKLMNQLNKTINKMISPNQTKYIEKSVKIIDQIILKYNYQFTNPTINVAISDFNKTLDNLIQNNKYTKSHLKYINTMEYKIVLLAAKDFNHVTLVEKKFN
jgi:hypothetical protein